MRARAQVCGQGPAATPEQLSGALFAGLPSSQAETLQGMMATCSYGKAEFSRALGSEVLTATVPIPCSGQTPYYRDYDSATCPFPGVCARISLRCTHAPAGRLPVANVACTLRTCCARRTNAPTPPAAPPPPAAAGAHAEWSDVANDYVQRVLGIDWSAYKYKVYVVPAGDLCSWGGMGWVGCQRDCRAWISGDLWMVRVRSSWLHACRLLGAACTQRPA